MKKESINKVIELLRKHRVVFEQPPTAGLVTFPMTYCLLYRKGKQDEQ